jgi:hypothetical protein
LRPGDPDDAQHDLPAAELLGAARMARLSADRLVLRDNQKATFAPLIVAL